MPVSLGLAGAGVLIGGIQSIAGASQASKAKKSLLNSINNQSVYQPSQYAQQALAEAQARENAKSAGVTYGENMASRGLANVYANAQKNASSGAQALGMGAVGQAQYNQAVTDLGQQQNAYNQQAIQNTNAARGGMINEQEKAFNSVMAKQSALQNLYTGQLGAGNAMLGQGLGTVASGLIGAAGLYSGKNPGEVGSPVNMESIQSKTTMPNFNVSTTGPTKSNYKMNAGNTASLLSSIGNLNANAFGVPNPNAGSFTPMKTNYPTFPSNSFNWW